MKYLLVFTFSFILSFGVFAQSNEEWKEKVSIKVFQEFVDSDHVEYMIQLKSKADVSLAKTLKSKEEKTNYVYSQLKRNALKSQKSLIFFLDKNKVDYKAFFIVNTILVNSDVSIMRDIAKREEVEFIEANPMAKVQEISSEIEFRDPNSVEWGIEKINADDVWGLGYTGDGIVVGGQDTGYRWTHEALKSKYRGWDGTTADHNYNWHDAIDSIDSHNSGSNPCGLSIKVPCDDNGHGTHTMGTMVGSYGTNDIGVAPDAKWIGCRNMERGWGKPSTYIECFEWFLAPTDTNNLNANTEMAPDVINNSWHCPASEGCDNTNYSTMEDAVNNLRSAGIVVVVSAGNAGPNCETIASPPNFFDASFDVGATDISDTIANFSSRGPTTGYGSSLLKPNISAPGVNIRSSKNANDSDYGNNSGTSMAGPHVAGAVALLLSAFPSFIGNPDTIEHILEQTAVFLDTDQSCGGVDGAETPNNTYGYGRLDVLAAINYVSSLLLRVLSFNAKITNDNFVELNWDVKKRGLEIIELQRSNNGFTWEVLKEGDAKGSILDRNPHNGINFYRLKINSNEGNVVFSKVISIVFKSRLKLLNYPTLLKNNEIIHIVVNDESGTKLEVSIFDYTGREVSLSFFQMKSNEENLSFRLSEYTSGVYIIVLKNSKTGEVLGKEKFVVI